MLIGRFYADFETGLADCPRKIGVIERSKHSIEIGSLDPLVGLI